MRKTTNGFGGLAAIIAIVALVVLGGAASGANAPDVINGDADATTATDIEVVDAPLATDVNDTVEASNDMDVIDSSNNQGAAADIEVVNAPETDVNDTVNANDTPDGGNVDSNVVNNDVAADTVLPPDTEALLVKTPACVCGDNYPDIRCNEECDDGNTDDLDGCSAKCCVEVGNWPARDCATAATNGGVR